MMLPKEIPVCGKMFKVIQDPNSSGASFNEGKQEITIGTKYPQDLLELLFHETLEGTLSMRDLRYAIETLEPNNGDYIFVFKHDQFEQAMKDLAFSLSFLLKGIANGKEHSRRTKKTK